MSKAKITVVLLFGAVTAVAVLVSVKAWQSRDVAASPVQEPEPPVELGPKTDGREQRPAAPSPAPVCLPPMPPTYSAGLNPDWRSARDHVVRLSATDPGAAVDWALKNMEPSGDLSFALHYAFWKLAERDPRAALARALAVPAGRCRESALRTVFQAWAKSDPENAARELAKREDFSTANLAIATVAYYWAGKDLKAATSWAWNLPEGAGRDYALANIGRRLYFSDGAAARAWAEQLPSGPTRNTTILAIASLVAEGDMEDAVQWVQQQIPGGRGSSPLLQVRLANWALHNRDEAQGWVTQLAGDREREKALATIAQILAKSNPRTASELAAAMMAGEEKTYTIRRIAESWAERDSEAAREWAEQLSDAGDRQTALDGLDSAGQGMEPTPGLDLLYLDQSIAVDLVEQLPDGALRNGLIHAIAVQWAIDDPSAAAVWAMEQLPAGRPMDTTVRVIVWDWASRDAETASEWALNLDDDHTKAGAVSTVTMALAKTDPSAAADFLRNMTEGETKISMLGSIAYQWAERDLEAASDWAGALSADEGRDYAIAQIGAYRAASDPDAALAWADSLSQDDARDSAIGGVAAQLAVTDLARSKNMALLLGECAGREKAFSTIVYAMLRDEPDLVLAWVDGLPAGRSKDQAVAALANSTVASDSAEACRLSETIQDTSIRTPALDRSVRAWRSTDATAADAWITGSSLSAEEKTRLLERN